MIDISGTGEDIRLYDSQVPKATNILSVQLGSLEYAQELGIDIDYFLSEDFEFQNESFKSYLVEVLARNGVNVAKVIELVESLSTKLTFEISPDETGGGLIAR